MRTVHQLSRPYQIALGAILMFAVVWFLALKPKEAVSEPPAATAPGVTGLGSAVDKAEGASAASDAANAATAAASATASGEAPASVVTPAGSARVPVSTSAPAGAAQGEDEAARRDPSGKVLRWLARGNVAVVTFYARGGADDKAVRRALKGLNRRDGAVRVFAADIAKVGAYEAINRGVAVLQAPTTLVISPDRRARKLVGFLDRAEVQQRVDDVLRAMDVKLSAATRKQIRAAARRGCAVGAERKACTAHLRKVAKACAAGRAAATDPAVILQKVTALKPPAQLAAGHSALLGVLGAQGAGAPAGDAIAGKVREAGYGACVDLV